MASLRDAVKNNATELRDGIAWVVFWRGGRSWDSEYIYLESTSDTVEYDDLGRLEQIGKTDSRAVALNGYYCGRLGENMTLDELTRGVRWHYDNGYNTLAAFMEEYNPVIPPEQLEAARQAAHAARLPFSERPYDGLEPDPYVYDGSMTPEDYELMQNNIAQERSERMTDPLSIQLHNRTRFEQGEPGKWLKLPATAEQLQVAMQRVGITAENPQDFFINGIESSIDAIARLSLENVQAAGVDELNYLASRLEAFDPVQIAKLDAAGDVLAYWDDVHHLTEYTHNTDFFVHIPDVFNPIQLGEYYLDKTDMIQMPEEWIGAIDIEMLGELAAEHEKGTFTDKGYILESGDEWEPVTEIPEQYRIMSYPQPEQEQQDAPNIDYNDISTRAPAVATEPQPVIPIVLTSEKPTEKLKEITDKLEQGIAGIFESEQYQDYLKTLSKFHNYSLNNTILIAMQKPDASHIAGYGAWKSNFERQVKKGEKGIKIIAPSPYKVKVQQEKTDPATGKPVIGADGNPVTEETERKIPAYKVVSVFDVSQTEGKELPTLGADILTGDVEQYKDFFAALEEASPVPVAFENIEGGANGYYHQVDKRIAIDEGMSELQTLKTTIHEIAHARLHDVNMKNEQGENEPPRADRRTREVEAESIAYTVCQHYGLDTSDYSFGYVAGWSSGKELAELKASLETIRTTAAHLITEIDGHFEELHKATELPLDRKQTAEHEQQQPAPELESPELFAQDFSMALDSFYKEHPTFSETAQMTNTSPAFVAHSIEVGYTVDLHRALNAMEAHPAYKEAADGLRARLEAITPIQQEQATEQQPGFEEWSEPANTENEPENPGEPSDDIDAYLPPQEEPPAQPTGTEPTEPTTTATYYPISEEAARHAKEANSYSDYRPGSATAEYRQSVDSAVEVAARQKARVDPMYHEKIDRLLDTYARKLAENMNNSNSIDSRVPSMLITGGGNFPVRKKEKQNAARDKNMEEWRDIQGLLDKIRSTGMGGISADDPNATKKLQEKLSGLEQSQETMKAANAYYRKHKTLDGCPVLSAEQIQKLTASMASRYYGRAATQPFEAYSLQNNNAEIRRVKGRIKELNSLNEAVFTGWQFDGGKVEVNKQDNRLQVFFDGKPDEATRTELKSNGFRWAPSVGAWQRQLTANAFYAANSVKSIQPLTGEKPTDMQRRARREADASQQQPEQADTFSIYQLKRDDSTRDFRFEPLERLQAAGLTIDPGKYELAYTAPITADTGGLEQIFQKFNIDRPEDFKGHSLSVSDIVTLYRDGEETAHYVDSFGFQEVPEFLQPAMPDNFLTGEKIETPRGSFSLTDMTLAQMEAAGYGLHHSSDDGRYHIMGNGTRAFAIINPLRTAEMSTEQNYNMIDGIPNNTPSVGELEARAKAGEQISLTDLAAAIKAERGSADRDTDKKPSIREQLKAAREQTQKDRPAPDKTRDKSPELEV